MFAKPTMQNSTIVPNILLPVLFFYFFYDVSLLQQTDISPTIAVLLVGALDQI